MSFTEIEIHKTNNFVGTLCKKRVPCAAIDTGINMYGITIQMYGIGIQNEYTR